MQNSTDLAVKLFNEYHSNSKLLQNTGPLQSGGHFFLQSIG